MDADFLLILEFLKNNPSYFSGRRKAWNLNHPEGVQALHDYYVSEKNKGLTFVRPNTIPDDAVSKILEVCCDIPVANLERIKLEHQLSMSAENLVGGLLELYIAKKLAPYGWVHCAGSFVKAVDFLKKDTESGDIIALQIKNRDNTENSSSSAIRAGTNIKKWFRTYSKTGASNWGSFPEPEFRNVLSEQGFMQFIEDYFQ